MSRDIKVTDKRMFTPDGELREEYRDVVGTVTAAEPGAAEPTAAEPAPAAAPAAPPAAAAPEPPPAAAEPEPPAGAPWETDEDAGPPLEIPGAPPGMGPSFFDLVSVLAEPAALYLGDMALPDGRTAENLDMARLYIELVDVLRHKTAGNLAAQESAFLEDVLYRLRMRYVQKRG